MYRIPFLLFFMVFCWNCSPAQEIELRIHLRGVAESDISLQPLINGTPRTSVAKQESVKAGDWAILHIAKKDLPGEYIVNYNYKNTLGAEAQSAQQLVLVNEQNLEWNVNPPFCNNPDSTKFQKGEIENTLMAEMGSDIQINKTDILSLQEFLTKYTDTKSDFYASAVVEIEKKRNKFNNSIKSVKKQYPNAFINQHLGFNYVPEMPFPSTAESRQEQQIAHYFDGIDFSNPWIIRTSSLKPFMDGYIGLVFQKAQIAGESNQDSLITLVAVNSIEKAKAGHPKVYGWMVDYFFAGMEAGGMEKPLEALIPYINDPNCLTEKRKAILTRLEGMKTILVGTKSPDFTMTDGTQFHNYHPDTKYKLVLFWSADCGHCLEAVKELYPYYLEIKDKNLIDVLAISVDETETEIEAYEEKKKKLAGWKHQRGAQGIRSKEAEAFYLLSTPIFVLVDSKTNIIAAKPIRPIELIDFLGKP